MLSFEYWRHRREMRRARRQWRRTLSPVARGPATDGERRIIELATAGGFALADGIRREFARLEDRPIERWAPPNYFAFATPEVVMGELVPRTARESWQLDDLVIVDRRVACPTSILVSLDQYSPGHPERPARLIVYARPPAGSASVSWPESLQADEWGYLAIGEQLAAGLPTNLTRLRSEEQFWERRPTESGPVPDWLAPILRTATTPVEPAGRVDRDDLAAAQRRLGADLPPALIAFYGWSDGGWIGGVRLLSVNELYLHDGVDHQLVMGVDDSGDAVCLELNTNRVVEIDHETGRIEVAGESFQAWLQAVAEA